MIYDTSKYTFLPPPAIAISLVPVWYHPATFPRSYPWAWAISVRLVRYMRLSLCEVHQLETYNILLKTNLSIQNAALIRETMWARSWTADAVSASSQLSKTAWIVVAEYMEYVSGVVCVNVSTNLSIWYLPCWESTSARRVIMLDTSSLMFGGLAPTTQSIASPR